MRLCEITVPLAKTEIIASMIVNPTPGMLQRILKDGADIRVLAKGKDIVVADANKMTHHAMRQTLLDAAHPIGHSHSDDWHITASNHSNFQFGKFRVGVFDTTNQIDQSRWNQGLRRALGLHERFLGQDHRQTKYYINPRYAETMALIAPDKNDYWRSGHESNELRGYMIGGNLYVWNAYAEIHKFGRESLHKDLGIGPDAYSGRGLVIRLKPDGTLEVMLGGIRPGYFKTVGPDIINKFARLKAALIPPQAPPVTTGDNHEIA